MCEYDEGYHNPERTAGFTSDAVRMDNIEYDLTCHGVTISVVCFGFAMEAVKKWTAEILRPARSWIYVCRQVVLRKFVKPQP